MCFLFSVKFSKSPSWHIFLVNLQSKKLYSTSILLTCRDLKNLTHTIQMWHVILTATKTPGETFSETQHLISTFPMGMILSQNTEPTPLNNSKMKLSSFFDSKAEFPSKKIILICKLFLCTGCKWNKTQNACREGNTGCSKSRVEQYSQLPSAQ